jgi:hypothetical protein
LGSPASLTISTDVPADAVRGAPHHLIDRILVVILVDDETSDLHDVVESARTSTNDALDDLPGELSLGYRVLVVELGR